MFPSCLSNARVWRQQTLYFCSHLIKTLRKQDYGVELLQKVTGEWDELVQSERR